MTAFSLSPAQRELAARVRDLAARELRPLAESGEPGRVNRGLVKAMGDLGLLARLFPGFASPSAEGPSPGAGAPAGAFPSRAEAALPGPADDALSRQASAMDLCLLREALATECTEAETALALQGLGAYPVLQSGQDEQVRRWLPAVAAGDAVPAFALTEPGAGSDAAALALTAEPDGDGWRLTGEKLWISNAPEADFYTVFARTTPGAGARGVSAFLVPADRPGLAGEHIEMISPHPIGRLAFDAVPVRREELLGERGRGFAVAMRTLEVFRPSVGAFAVGMAQAALDAAVAHAASRTAFGGPLAGQQAVAHLLAEMATRTEAARLLVYSAAAALDAAGQDVADQAARPPRDAAAGAARASHGAGRAQEDLAGRRSLASRSAMAKLFATETAQFVVDSAIQIHGARALARGHPLEHLYREVRAPRIYEGASEIQRTVIARGLLPRLRDQGTAVHPTAPTP